MAYSGYLIKVGDYIIPQDKIRAETYNAVLHIQDLDSARNANGILQRNALQHTIPEVNFNLCAMLTNSEVSEIFGKIRDNYTNYLERQVYATVYVPELDDYIKQNMYLPDITFPVYGTYGNKIIYEEIALSFIGY